MAREIKFRAWDGKYMKYIDDFYWFEEEGVHDSKGNGAHRQYELMQGTGLKDKNGREIYEGDVLETGNDVAGISVHALVEYLDDGFSLVEKDGNCCGLADSVFHGGWDGTTGKATSPAYVIGNIYENPELLEQTS